MNLVARVVSMFFMVTYGTLCAISFLEHFAASPSYRPSFRSKWWVSLFGAFTCVFMMFQMDPLIALVAVFIMVGLYRFLRSRHDDGDGDLGAIFSGVIGQSTRFAHLRLQKTDDVAGRNWRPSVIMVSEHSFERRSPVLFMEWLCLRHGFGTYLHLVRGLLNAEKHAESTELRDRLLESGAARSSALYLDTVVSPSLRSAVAQALQLPGISGLPNNTLLCAFDVSDADEVISDCIDSSTLAGACRMNTLVLRHGDRFFGNRRDIHIWLTWNDYDNANLMVLLAYILLGHADWKGAEIRIFAALPRQEVETETAKLHDLVTAGRLPISLKNLEIVPTDSPGTFTELVHARSRSADLVVMGATPQRLQSRGAPAAPRGSGRRALRGVPSGSSSIEAPAASPPRDQPGAAGAPSVANQRRQSQRGWSSVR